MNDLEYFQERVDDQIKWYDKKSIRYKKCHGFIIITSLITTSAGSLITILGLIFSNFNILFTIIGAISGFSVSFMLALDKFKNFHEHFLMYRMTCEKLKQEKFLYLTKSGEYKNNSDAFNLLVERIESIMATENQTWAQLTEKKSQSS